MGVKWYETSRVDMLGHVTWYLTLPGLKTWDDNIDTFMTTCNLFKVTNIFQHTPQIEAFALNEFFYKYGNTDCPNDDFQIDWFVNV